LEKAGRVRLQQARPAVPTTIPEKALFAPVKQRARPLAAGLNFPFLMHVGDQVDAAADNNDRRDSPQQTDWHCSLLIPVSLP
jgi:hypothetical protein